MIRPRDLLAEAGLLLDGALTEVRRRTVVNRSYYAAFHFLRSHPCASGSVDDTGRSAHRQLIGHLSSHSDPRVRHCASLLQRTFARRLIADYGLAQQVSRDDALDSVEDAREIIREALADFSGGDGS